MVTDFHVPQTGAKTNPLNYDGMHPQLSDPSKPGTAIGLPAPWIEWLEEVAKGGNIIK